MACTFAVEGDVRFVSHRDMLRLFARAAARAALPVRYSEGFNPHPRLVIPVPRPVGVASEVDRLVIDLTHPFDPDDMLSRLTPHLPNGIAIMRAWRLERQDRCQPARVRYRLDHPVESASQVRERAASLLGPESILVKRTNAKSGRSREVDLRPSLDSVTVQDDCLEFCLRVTPTLTAKPEEVLACLGLPAAELRHRLRRVEIEWQPS